MIRQFFPKVEDYINCSPEEFFDKFVEESKEVVQAYNRKDFIHLRTEILDIIQLYASWCYKWNTNLFDIAKSNSDKMSRSELEKTMFRLIKTINSKGKLNMEEFSILYAVCYNYHYLLCGDNAVIVLNDYQKHLDKINSYIKSGRTKNKAKEVID